MDIRIIGAVRNGKSLLGSEYMAKELSLLGFPLTQIPIKENSQLEQAFLTPPDQGGSVVICPFSGAQSIDERMLALIAKVSGHGLKQSGKLLLPDGARVFPIEMEGYPGFELSGNGYYFYVLPPDKLEQISIFFNFIYPNLSKDSQCASRVIRIMELPAEKVEAVLKDMLGKTNPCIAVYPKNSEIIVRVSAKGKNRQEAIAACTSLTNIIAKRLGNFVYGVDVNSVAHALVLKCTQKGLKLAIAESANNSNVMKKVAAIQGGKDCIASSNSFQPDTMDLPKLGISDKIGKKFGPVSVNVAAAMALGASKENERNYIGVGVSLPNANVKGKYGYVAACMGDSCLVKEIDVQDYKSISQMIEGATEQALNLARKFADTYPNAPLGSASAEDTVLQGMAAFGATSTAMARFESEPTGLAKNEEPETQIKPKGVKRILSAIFPTKADSGFDKFRKVALILCVCVFIGAMTYLVTFKMSTQKSEKNISNLQQQMAEAEEKAEAEPVSNIEGYPSDYLPKFASFYKENEDIKGWLKIPNTNVNFPVVQTVDNDYYHRLGFNKEYDYYGTPYLDYEVDVKKPSTNVIIYGHNIKSDGQMFNDLTKYKNLDFYKSNPVVNFDSVYKTGSYKIIGAFITNALPAQDEGKTFEYTHFVDTDSKEEFDEFVNEVKRRSIFNTPVDVEFGDQLLTLSTCTYEFRPEARFVVVARRVRENESEEVDTSKAEMNATAYYPKAYRDAKALANMYGKVKSIAIKDKKDITLQVGETVTLNAQVSPADAPINTFTWDSSNKAAATVDKNTGVVTAVAAGEAVITVQADDGGTVDNVKVTVTGDGSTAEGLTLSNTTLSMKPGSTRTLSTTFKPEDAKADLTWKSSDEAIAKVSGDSSSATVTAVAAGTATITATTTDGTLTATCTVTIAEDATESEDTPVEAQSNETAATGIAFSSATLDLPVGQSQTLTLVATPTDGNIGTVEYTFDSNAVTVNKASEGSVIVKGSSVGTGVLTAKSSTGLTATCTIKVSAVEVSDSMLSLSDLTLVSGETGNISYSVTPEDTELVWTSDNPRIADVDNTGYVTTMPDLTETTKVTITAASTDGTLKQSAIVTVQAVGGDGGDNGENGDNEANQGDNNNSGNQTDTPLKVKADPITVEVDMGGVIPIHITTTSEFDTEVRCSTNSDIIDVDNEGNVFAYNPGKAEVTITVDNTATGESVTTTVLVTITDPYGNSDYTYGDEGNSGYYTGE